MSVAVLILAFLVAGLLVSPLTGVTGYESSQILAILLPSLVLISSGDGWTNWAVGQKHRAGSLVLFLGLMLFLPVAALSLNSLRIPNCAPWQGLGFYLLLVGGNMAIQLGAWVWLSAALGGTWRVRIAWIVLVFGALVLTLWQPLRHPQLFAYSAFWGFFPGPLYDEVLVINDKLLLSRATGLSLALYFWCAALARRSRGVDGHWWRRISYLGLVLALAGWSQFPKYHLTGSASQVQNSLGGKLVTRHAVLHYPVSLFEGAAGAKRLEAVADDIDFNFESVSDWLELTVGERQPVTVYLYRSPAEKKRLIGAGGTQFANVWRRELHINYEDPPHSVLRHEMVHLLASGWAPPLGMPFLRIGLLEGLAEAAERTDVRFTPEAWSRYLEDSGKRIPLEDLLAPWDFWRAPSNRAYGEWGAFTGWLMAEKGVGPLRRIYGGEDFRSAYGKSLDELEQDWVRSLKAVELTPFERWSAEESSRRRSLFEKPCARELARLREMRDGHLREAEGKEALSVCKAIDGFGFNVVDDLWRWTEAVAATGDRALFAELAGKIREHPDQDSGMRRNLELLEADQAAKDGRLQDALEGYFGAMAPDWNSGPQREIVLKAAAIESGDSVTQEELMRYLSPGNAPVETEMFLLRMAQRESSAAWVFSYLLLKRLAAREAWEEIEGWRDGLKWDRSFPEFRVDWERQRIMARLDYELGRLDKAATQYARMAESSPWRGDRRELSDWADRARWKQAQAAPR